MGTSSSGMSLYKSGSGKSCSYSGLKNGQKYYWKVIVYNGSGKSAQSTTWNFTTKDTPAPTTPSSPTPSDGATNVAVSGTLKWSCSANDGGTTLSYDLYMGTSSSNMTLYKSGSGTSCAYSGLSAGKKYYWKLIAYNGSGKSTQGPVWSFTTKEVAAPSTPSSPSPSNGATNVAVSGTLKWSCSANDGGTTLSYDLYMGTSSSNMTLYKSGSGTSCAYSGLSAGKKYYWKLIAYNGSGKSTQGPVWSFTTKEVAAPSTPSSPSPSNGATNVAVSGTLKWSCSANDGGTTLSYDLYMGTSSSNMTLYKSGQGKSCAYSGLANGKTYYWKLIAYNGSGKSTQSPTWSFTTKDAPTVSAPTTPSSPSPSNGAMNVGTSGTFSWSCSPNDGGTTLSYDLYMGTSSSNMTLYKSGQGKSCAYSGLSNGKTYYWKLIAYNGSGKSTQSPTWSFTTTNSSTVSAPTTPSSPSPSNGAMNVGTSGTLKWNCSPNDGGTTLSYDLYIGTSANNMVLYKSGQGTSCSYSLAANTTYYWKLIAYNGSGKSTQSPTWSFTTTNSSTVSAPTTPSSPSPSNGAMNVGTSGTLKWNCSPNDGGTTLSYDLYIGTSANNMVLYKSGQGTSCSYSLAANTTYYWKLIAYNGSGKSTQSPTWSFTTKAATVNAPTTPSSPSPSSGAMNVGTSGILKWNCSPNDGGTTLSYDLYIGTSANNMTLYKSGQGTSCNYSLASNTTYYWKLIAYNGSGKSTHSPTWSFTTGKSSTSTTLPAPNPSTFNATNITETGFTASWGAVSGAKYYDIKVKSEGGTYEQAVFSQATASTSVNVTGLTPGTSYKFRLRARNGNHNENSDWSGDIPTSVKTKSQGTAPANLTIYKNSGIDGTKSLIAGKTYHYNVLVLNSGSSTWKGAFYLKDGNILLKPWYNISLPKGVAQPLEFDYTPQNTGNKILTLYYQTNNSGDGIPVKPGNSTNPMTVKVLADPSVYDGLKLKAAISSPTTMELGKQTPIAAQVTNTGSEKWEGKLYLTDNGSVITEQENLESGKTKTLFYGAWKPLTTGTHNIAVYYQSKEGSSQQLVNANGFKNPVTVVVSNADVSGDASKVVIKHITASVEPKEVTPGTVVMYHYRLLDENGKQLRNMKLRFKYDHNNMTKYIDSEPSDLEGYAVLYLATSGTNAIAGRGQTVNLECMQAINENNKTIPISASDSEKKISLKIHQGTSFSRANGFENVEKVKLTISPGVSFKIDKSISSIDFLGQKAKAKVSLGFPIGISLKWDDYGYVSECAADIGVKLSASGSTSKEKENMTKLEKYIPSVKGKIGTGYRISFTTDPKEVIIKFVMGWIDNYTEGTDWKTDLAVKAMRKWFEDRNNIRVDQSFYYSFGAEISGNIFSIWPGSDEIKEAIKPVLSIKDLNLSGNGNITIEPWKTKGDNLRGYSTAVKLGGAFEFKGKVHNLIDLARTRMRGEPITEAYYDREIFNDKFFYGSASIKYSSDFSMKHDEMYNKSDRSIEQVSQQMALSSSWDFSTENLQIGDFLTDGWFPLDFSLGYTNKYTQKVSSKGDWTRFLHRQVISENQYMNDVLQVFPNLSYKTYFAPPLKIYNTWQKDFDIPLARLASITPNPNSYELKDALKFERTVSSEFDASLSLRIYDWGWAKFYIDTDVNLELENKPNESYFSIPDRRTFDVVLRPTTTIKETAKNSIKYAGDLIFQTFEEEHPKILKAWEWMKQTYNMVVDEFGNVVQMVDNAIGDEAEHAFYLFWYHWYMHDRYNANAKHAMRKHPLLAEKEQTDICKFALGINKEERNFNPGVKIEVPHYYPAGDLLGITEQGDTLFVVSEVIDIIATQGVDTLRTTQAGQFQMETTIGVDDLTPFGFPEDTPLGLYHAEEGSKIWSYVGPAGSTIMTDKLGAYMIATSIKNDVITPEILADYDKTYGVIHLNIKDNIGVRIGSLSITINGEEKEFSMISESSIDVYLTDEEMQHMITLYVTINDLAGNQGTLFQMYNLDMPTTIEDVKTEDDKTSVQFKDHQLKVEGAKANATICVFSVNGNLVAKAKADEQGRATVQLSSVPDGLYVFTISNGKSGKILVKKVG